MIIKTYDTDVPTMEDETEKKSRSYTFLADLIVVYYDM